ncbi:MAG: Ig-like domain-containing protein [Nannocystaceae bacterium]|nr:Ig-like domain-containing protein [Nannocystaceae bacterium]
MSAQDSPGLTIRLGHADPESARTQRPAPAKAQTLGEADTAKVLARLPKLPSAPDDAAGFAMREGSKPPPRPGATVLAAFPPRATATPAEVAPSGPLSVLRFAPEGDVPVAPHVSVTFDQPMVPVTSLAELAAKDVPVELAPQPKGAWRWIGTKTLRFEPAERMPMATAYSVTVPAGTRSASGNKLAKATTFRFTTPAPTVTQFFPQRGPTIRNPILFVHFDQAIEPKTVAPTIRLRAGRKGELAVRLATADEIAADETVRTLADQATAGRWLAVTPATTLPADSDVHVEIGPGVPSAEGPRKSSKAAQYEFRTFGPMRVREHSCGYDGRCPPGTPLVVQFTNPIDAERFDPAMVTVSPPLDGMTVEFWGDTLHIAGATKGRTKYEVTLAEGLPDEFGQRLGRSKPLDFKTTDAEPTLWAPGSGMVVLDPAAAGRFSVFSVNHRELRVRAFAVAPSDLPGYYKMLERLREDSRDLAAPGKKVIETEIRPRRDEDAIVETAIDLGPALRKGLGHAIVIVEPTTKPKEPWMQQRVVAWVQSTRIGLSAHLDAEAMTVWASALADGGPLAGVTVELLAGASKSPVAASATDATGLATLPLSKRAAAVLVARLGDDVALLTENPWWWQAETSWMVNKPSDELRWYVFDDRHLYRPGETVKLKGWLRRFDPDKRGDLGAIASTLRQVRYTLSDSVGNKISEGKLALNAFGAFDTSLALPKTMNTGGAQLVLSVDKSVGGNEYWHSFDVQEFRRPEYEVTTRLSEGPHVLGEQARATVAANYYAGGGLAGAAVSWRVTASPGHYQPPGHDDFVFGKYEPWWCFWRGWGPWRPDPADQPRTFTFEAATDGAGEHPLRMDFVSMKPARAMSVTAEATVTDVNRQAWSGSSSTVVHPARTYVGLRSDRAFVQAGESIELDVIAVDIDGKAVVDAPLSLRAVRLQTVQKRGEYVETEHDPQTCERKSAAAPVRCSLKVAKGGSWRITAVTTDARGRENRTQMELWVAGGELPAPRDVSQEQVLLIPDRQEYAAGDTARIAVSAPWPGAHGLVTLRRSGLLEARRIELDGNATVIEVPIDDTLVPSVTVQVDLAGAAVRRDEDGTLQPKLPKRVAFASGSVALAVPPRQRTLALDVRPAAAKLAPGSKTEVEVTVRDAKGTAVAGAEVALVVVDESVLALTGYRLPDPLAVFYGWRDPGVRDHYSRSMVVLASASAVAQSVTANTRGAPGGGDAATATSPAADAAPPAPPESPKPEPTPAKKAPAGVKSKNGDDGSPIALRSDFSALAAFSPSVVTDARGVATLPFTLPDNLTRYRVMAVAVAGERQFGAGESAVTARLPLMVRPSAPRFLNFGDQFELPVVVQNQTDAAMTVDVAVRASNAALTAGAGRRVQVPANDRVEVRFPATTARAGVARFQVGAAAGRDAADAAQFELPVWTPATTEAFATYGEIDDGAIVQPVAAPAGVFAEFGGLEITTSSTALAALTDAVVYLVAYPFECSEQIASRVLAIASLRDVLAAFAAEGLPPERELVAAVGRDLDRLARLQTEDGGFSFWGRGWPAWPHLSIHGLHALERAKLAGFDVPKDMLTRARAHVDDIESHIPADYPLEVKRSLRAYALYVRAVGGSPDATKARKLVDEVGPDKLPIEAIGWLLPTLAPDAAASKMVAAMMRVLENRVSETAAGAHFDTGYSDGAHLLLHSDRRADAVVLEALVAVAPKHDLIAKLVRGLLDHRTAGRWSSTQENGFVLVALDRYFDVFEKATPDFVARAWLGPRLAGEHDFHGRTTEHAHVDVPMKWLMEPKHAKDDLVLGKSGKGRMYYRVGMRYAPRDLMLPALDAGFAVTRRYEAVDEPGDVRRDASGVWHIKAGARVRVRLEMVAPTRRYHVALVDPLPAGLEVVNPGLATSGALPPDPADDDGGGRFWWWMRTWYEHQNLRDERVEAFTSLLWEGVHDYDYVARATTPGEFVVPPPKAEEMYHPETFGRGGSDRVIVE